MRHVSTGHAPPLGAPARVSDTPHGEAPRSTGLPRILVLTPIYPWPGSPPEGIFVHRQVRNLARLGHAVKVIAYHPAIPGLPRALAPISWGRYHPRWMLRSGEQDGIRVEHIFYPQRRYNRGDVVPAITEAICRFIERNPEYQDTDVVYAHWLWTGGAAAIGVRERFGWPVAAIARGSEMHRWQSVYPHCRSHVERVIGEADLLLANCEYLRSKMTDLLPGAAERARVARNGCDHGLFRPAPDRERVRREVAFSPGLRYFVCTATVAEHKGLLDLAVAWRRFSATQPDWRLVVVGPIAQRKIAREFRRAAGASAELRGRVGSDRVVTFLQAADGYVQPSRLEGLSNATMEAMAVGLPIVATSAGGQQEVVRGGVNGWLVPVNDPAALADAMDELARAPHIAKARGESARQTIIERFDPISEVSGLSARLVELHEVSGAATRFGRTRV